MLLLATCAGVPLLGSEPETSQLYSTKAGARELFKSAQVAFPPYEADIFSMEQMVKSLATLIANNLLVPCWIFKLPEQTRGRGFGELVTIGPLWFLTCTYYPFSLLQCD